MYVITNERVAKCVLNFKQKNSRKFSDRIVKLWTSEIISVFNHLNRQIKQKLQFYTGK